MQMRAAEWAVVPGSSDSRIERSHISSASITSEFGAGAPVLKFRAGGDRSAQSELKGNRWQMTNGRRDGKVAPAARSWEDQDSSQTFSKCCSSAWCCSQPCTPLR